MACCDLCSFKGFFEATDSGEESAAGSGSAEGCQPQPAVIVLLPLLLGLGKVCVRTTCVYVAVATWAFCMHCSTKLYRPTEDPLAQQTCHRTLPATSNQAEPWYTQPAGNICNQHSYIPFGVTSWLGGAGGYEWCLLLVFLSFDTTQACRQDQLKRSLQSH